MSKIKNHLIDIYREDWTQRLESLAQARRLNYGRK